MFLGCVINVGLKVPKIYFSLLIFRNKEARFIWFTQCKKCGTGYVGEQFGKNKIFHNLHYFRNNACFCFFGYKKKLEIELSWHIYKNKLISVGMYLLITVGNKERKTNLFVPYFIFMGLLMRRFDWHRWYKLSAFFRSSWGLRFTYHSLPLCYQGLLWLSFHSLNCVVMNCTLGNF